MSKSATVIQILQARLERAIRQRRENPSRSDILMIPVLALALDACGGGGSQRPTPPPPPPPPPPPAATITADATGAIDENAEGATVVAVTTTNATSVTVDDDRFEVAGGNLKLKDGTSLDFEAVSSPISVTITASGDGASATHTVSVGVNDVNEAPSAPEARSSSVTIEENSMGASITSLAAPSADPEGEDATYHVSDDRFEVDENLIVKLKSGEYLNHEDGPVTITITAMDSAGNVSGGATITVNTSNVNEAPSIVIAAATVPDAQAAGVNPDLSVDEDSDGSVPGGVVAHIALSDPDAGDSHTLSVDDTRFEVIDAFGQKWLKLKEGIELDHETEDSIEIKVTVTDAGNGGDALSAMGMVTIVVNDVNEAPAISVADGETPGLMPASSTVAENTPGALLGAITLTDPDEANTHSLSVSDDRFETKQDAAGGWWLKLKDGVSLDYEASGGTVTVAVTVTDGGGLSDSTDVMITVTDVNEAPTVPSVRNNAKSISENDSGASITVVEGSSDPEGDDFTYLVDNDHFEITDDGILKLKDDAALDYEASATVTLEVTAMDARGNVSGSVAVTVTVDDVHENSPPTISVDGSGSAGGVTASSTVAENAPGAIVGLISPGDADAGDAHTVTVDHESFEVIGPGDNAPGGAWWLKLKDDASLNYEDGDTVTVTVTVEDNGNPAMTGAAEFVVTVTDVNEAPTVSVTGGATVPNEEMTVSSLSVNENAMGKDLPPLALIEVMDPDAGEALTGESGAASITFSDDRFKVKLDPENGLWLALKDDASLDYEDDGETVTVTVTYTDSGGIAASRDVDVAVIDVNEAPEATGEGLQAQYQMAGDAIAWEVNLSEVFKDADADADAGDFTYSVTVNVVEGNGGFPALVIDSEVNDDGHVIGTITSVDAIAADLKPSVFEVTITATDGDESDPQSGAATFMVYVDDRNDAITAINLFHPVDAEGEEDPNETHEVEVEENFSGETIFGRITVDDPDNDFNIAGHPHGQHTVDVDADSKAKGFFIKVDNDGGWWLAHAANNPLDHETESLITVTITATDMAQDSSSLKQTVLVSVEDVNEAPKGLDEMGNWWVTVSEDLEEEDVTAGEWLSFALETEGDVQPAFTDPDDDANGMLTYSLVSGPSWLEVVSATGVIQNKAEALPSQDSGSDQVTIRATDGGELSDTVTFRITWATSGDDNEDNDAPHLDGDDVAYVEGSPAGTVVANFRVEDDDSGLTGHPFAPRAPEITSATDSDDASISYRDAFVLEPRGPNTWVVKTTSSPSRPLDHEASDEITITINVADGAGGTDSLEIDLDVDDRNEKPIFDESQVTITTVNQAADVVQTVFINLFDAWEDEDSKDDDDDLSFTVRSNVPWIKVLHAPAEWGDIKDKDDDGEGVDDEWGGSSTPEDDDYVVILEIDRTGANNRQADVANGGIITLTARDDRGGPMATETIPVMIEDQNLTAADAVTISGTPREGHVLQADFDEDQDPDLVGDGAMAYQVVYTWSSVDDGGTPTVRQKGLSNRYTATQEDVGTTIKVSVAYYELLPGGDFGTTAQAGGEATTADMVLNTPDAGSLSSEIRVNDDENGLTAVIDINDEDGVPAAGETGAPTHTWESSLNGVSGWQVVDPGDDTGDTELSLTDGAGLYYRVVVRYKDEQKTDRESEERLVSESIKVGTLAAPDAAPALNDNPVPGTLQLDNVGAGDTVVWQRLTGDDASSDDPSDWMDVGDGSVLNIAGFVGETLRAVVHHMDANGHTARTVVGGGDAISGPANTPPARTQDHVVEAEVNNNGVTTVTSEVSLSELFTDSDGDTLTFTVAQGAGAPANTVTATDNSPGIYIGANDQGLISFDLHTGMLRYDSDEDSAHDGDGADGGGNEVVIVITASDGGDTGATANVIIRLNVKATRITEEGSVTAVAESTPAEAGSLGLTLNVQDENSPENDFGAYDWTISDDRFTITADSADRSRAVLGVADGATFENAGANGQDGSLTVTVTATEKGSGNQVTHMVTVAVTNNPDNDTPAPTPTTAPDANDVPGLKDQDDDTDDTDNDNDGDGGFPPDLMVLEGDLLDSFILAIDDIDMA